MKKTMLFELLNTFSTGELRRWSEFVDSDYHCKNIHLKQLSIILLLSIKHQRNLEKQDAWEHLFPKVNYNESKLNNYLSDLLAVSYRFLEETFFLEKQNVRFEYLQQQLIDKGLNLQASRVAKKWDKNLANSPLNNPDAIFDKFRYHLIQNGFSLLSNDKRTFDRHLQSQSKHFEHFYLLQQLINYSEILNRSNIVKGDYELHYLEELLLRYNQNKLDEQNSLSIQIYILIFEMLRGENPEEKFSSIEALMLNNQQCFSPTENRTIYNYLINFCVKKINSGILSYHKKLFRIYQVLIEQDLLLRNGQISQWTYRNIIAVGVNVNGWEWTQNFLENYKKFLPKANRHNAYYYNLAVLNFERQEYDKALMPLNELKYADAFYQMAAKTILLKIYYTLNQGDAFTALAAASRQFVTRNKQLSNYQQKSSLNFISLLQKMFTFRSIQSIWTLKKRIIRLEYFKNKLASPGFPISNRGWLERELSREELKNKSK